MYHMLVCSMYMGKKLSLLGVQNAEAPSGLFLELAMWDQLKARLRCWN